MAKIVVAKKGGGGRTDRAQKIFRAMKPLYDIDDISDANM